jgi:transcriptional regulator with XRE-family HTH domain
MLVLQLLEGKRVIMEEKTLGRRLAEARAERRWSLREVERRTGISNAHISQIETGGIERPAPNVLWALASVYELDLGELMRMSGHVEAASKATPGSVVGAALRELGELTPEEQEQVLDFMKSLQKGKGTGQQPPG